MPESCLSLSVVRVTDASDEIRLFELASADGSPLPNFTPGAHIDVHLGPGLIRQYSLCNGPDALDRYLIAVKREPASRGGSQKMHDEVKVGDLLTVTGPRNHFPLAPDASGHLLLAGGIGVTPLLSMARHLKANGERFRLEYFTRSPAHTAFHAELSDPAWAGEVDFHYGIGPDRLVPYLRGILEQRPEGGHLYVCGPRPFMEMVEDIASHIYPPGSVHSEYFSADPMALAGPKESFRVRCARSQKEFEVPEADTIVNVLTRNGVHVEVMCEQGVCGTCLTGVLEGQPDHRDAYLTEEERQSNEKILVCCSRSLTPLLVLDL